MKKIILILMLLMVSSSLFAIPTWNPWPAPWAFYFGEEIHYFDFDSKGNVEDENGNEFTYDWDMTCLYIYDYEGNNYVFEIVMKDYDSRFEGVEVNSGLKIHGHTSK